MATNEEKTFTSSNVEDVGSGELRRRYGSEKPIPDKSMGDMGENEDKEHLSDSARPTTPTAATSSSDSVVNDTDSDAEWVSEDKAAISTKDGYPKDIPILDHNTYWLTRIVMLRSVAFICYNVYLVCTDWQIASYHDVIGLFSKKQQAQAVYSEGLRIRDVQTTTICKLMGTSSRIEGGVNVRECVAFTVALHQNRALIGKQGLLPADIYLDDVRLQAERKQWRMFSFAPTLLWLQDYEADLNQLLDVIAYSGLLLSGMVFVLGAANIPTMFTIWVLYHSLVSVGQRWYSFGWESQVLETLFLTMLLCPATRLWHLPRDSPSPITTVWLYRWLIFRIMLGAGLIKLRGDTCWWDLTCMKYHYETQPLPNPLAYYMHTSPLWFHKWEVLVNHFVELPAPFLILLPHRGLRQVGGIIQIAFQMLIIISGNLSFLNWLTMLPCIACFDDASLAWLFRHTTKWDVFRLQQEAKSVIQLRPTWSRRVRQLFNLATTVFIAYLSVPIMQNLWSSQQVMNTSFEPLRIVNTYGAFGSVTKERTELIIQGTYSNQPLSPLAEWHEYEFKCKPGNVTRRPCIISPYHYRLDWLMWFAAFGKYEQNNWLVHLVAKLLANDKDITALMAHNPFERTDPPKFVRVEHYRYSYTKVGSRAARRGAWWKRKRIGSYLPSLSLEALEPYLRSYGWSVPQLPGDEESRGKKGKRERKPKVQMACNKQ